VALSIPEARVFALPESQHGAIASTAAPAVADRANQAQALLVGPGMLDPGEVARLLERVIPDLHGPTVVLDACAVTCLSASAVSLRALHGNVVLTPHAGEMAALLGIEDSAVTRAPLAVARRAAAETGAVVALKGWETYIVAPDGTAYRNQAGNVGLATSGSGDTLAGIIAGLAARGAGALQAAVWAVYLHARAGDRLAGRMGLLGFLARELLTEIPPLLAGLQGRDRPHPRAP
jgi:hydroxyethylthiazole kinase-like uncharacterized protein yjeF